MSGVGRKKNKDRIGDEGSDAVEELLHAAEDDMLLGISIDSHAARSNHLEADLARRLQALKIPSSSPNITKKPLPPLQQIPPVVVDDELKMILGADLSSRFAALKASSSSSSSSTFSSSKQVQGLSWKFEDDTGDDDVDDGGVSKKEVDKVIQWAMDAARLDPSPASDDDDELDSDDDELDSDEDKDERKKLKKGEIKKKKDQRDECRTHKANDM